MTISYFLFVDNNPRILVSARVLFKTLMCIFRCKYRVSGSCESGTYEAFKALYASGINNRLVSCQSCFTSTEEYILFLFNETIDRSDEGGFSGCSFEFVTRPIAAPCLPCTENRCRLLYRLS